jgi:drug/metabolite transporter (DMT)-like permease
MRKKEKEAKGGMKAGGRKSSAGDPLFLSYGLYTLAMLIFGTNGVLVARLSLAASQIVLLRTLLGGAALTVLVLLRGGFDREAVRSDLVFLLLGGTVLGANWVALFEAFRLLNVSLATLIYYVGPMLVLLLSPFLFREKLTGAKIAAVCFVAVGLVCISGSIAFGGLSVSGLFVAMLSALFYASLIVFNKRIVRTAGMQTAAIELDVAFLVVLLYVLLTVGLPCPQRSDLPCIALIGLVNTGLAYVLYFSGLQRLPGQSVALISYVDPVSTLLYSALLLHEVLTPLQLFGAVLIIGGALFGELRGRRGGSRT